MENITQPGGKEGGKVIKNTSQSKETEPVLEGEESFQKRVSSRFWKLTDRNKKCKDREDLCGPKDYHEWGRMFDWKKKSPTLERLLAEMQNVDELDHVKILHGILTELEMKYNIKSLRCLPKTLRVDQDHKEIIAYDIQGNAFQQFSFMGVAKTKKEATAKAARKGVEFFKVLAA